MLKRRIEEFKAKMVGDKSELYVKVPSFFRCPISMDVMKSPVSLSTGVTYDRASIKTWLDSGHNTCPATMQVLQSTDVVPNLTLRRLIRVWSDSVLSSDASPSFISSVSKQQALDSVKAMANHSSKDNCVKYLTTVIEFLKFSDENRDFLASSDEFVSAIVAVLSNVDEIGVIESVVTVLDLIVSERRAMEELNRLMLKSNRDCFPPFIKILQSDNLVAKIRSAKVLESIAFDAESQRAIADKPGLLHQLFRLVDGSETDCRALDAGLSALIAISSTSRPAKKELVRLGIVRAAGSILSRSDTVAPLVEKAMKVLETVSTCTEGRTAICEDGACVVVIVNRLMKVSQAATEHGVGVLWSVCYLSRDRAAQEAVMRCNGLTKVLLVMQSNCSAGSRQMCGDLVKVFRVNSKSCLASYETRTTHISPY